MIFYMQRFVAVVNFVLCLNPLWGQCCHLIHSIVTMSTETGRGKHKEHRPKKQYVALLTVSQFIES